MLKKVHADQLSAEMAQNGRLGLYWDEFRPQNRLKKVQKGSKDVSYGWGVSASRHPPISAIFRKNLEISHCYAEFCLFSHVRGAR
jgi:hypothetical protein